MNLVTLEFAPSTDFSTSKCETSLWGSLTSASDKEVAGQMAEMAGAELKELKEKLSGCETRRTERIKDIVNGYPIVCNKDFATVERLQDLEGLTELSHENHVETEKQLHEDLEISNKVLVYKAFELYRVGPFHLPRSSHDSSGSNDVEGAIEEPAFSEVVEDASDIPAGVVMGHIGSGSIDDGFLVAEAGGLGCRGC
ncbi:hypothetical protein BYT27DRAFT_7206328 [Phlegmacium glaucopus]|nr:hypothetical protein BYT27DRAFT_7206328 [Phlegmacium glaucopus]